MLGKLVSCQQGQRGRPKTTSMSDFQDLFVLENISFPNTRKTDPFLLPLLHDSEFVEVINSFSLRSYFLSGGRKTDRDFSEFN